MVLAQGQCSGLGPDARLLGRSASSQTTSMKGRARSLQRGIQIIIGAQLHITLRTALHIDILFTVGTRETVTEAETSIALNDSVHHGTARALSQALKQRQVILQRLASPDLLQLAVCHPVLCWPHLQVISGCHGHAVGTRVMHNQAIAGVRRWQLPLLAQEIC